MNERGNVDFWLTAAERKCLHPYETGGGLQQLINRIVEADREGVIEVSPIDTLRIVKYALSSGEGGPNDALRKAFARSLFEHGLIDEVIYDTWRYRWPHVVS